eukprot:CAMPEP_0175077168 /NCGR_PEP_ID=MMETSP0052_2-20121109/23216_1 /TAXON_ID=51329 ORGANISM="Polytomella parva, Strain SAG 63-3" /NCGR_SAMPLE_ID=MMETSP0052_2 /ASSEMBLY_ACC=CAM_ASM_000194 /LENGTH=971 /DNA_ID=CAMNT_0016346555 /DNA_START=120 /DNA_END=3032 /DNA_ORIENTATION=+
MPILKEIERSATVAFCPQSSLLAAGTVAGAIDISFSTSSILEVFALDYSAGPEVPLVSGSVTAPERFNRLAWSNKLSDTYQSGILAGGLTDGCVCLWNPYSILDRSKSESKPALLAKMQKHTGPVKGLEFNAFSSNLLASGAADGDLCIWDIARPNSPSLYPALKSSAGGAAAAASSEVTCLSWNKKVQHILASCGGGTGGGGATVVWDLKRQKPVISFKDPNSQRRASALQWHPEVATQLVVASDDDRTPTLQVWDLRNSVSPLMELVGHSKGVLGLAWSSHDASLLLSSAKDNRTLVWDVTKGEILCEMPVTSNWNFDVHWSPNCPGVFSTASFDGKIGLHSLLSCAVGSTVTEVINADFSVTRTVKTEAAPPLKHVPNWMLRPCGATFGFGGKLVSFGPGNSGASAGAAVVGGVGGGVGGAGVGGGAGGATTTSAASSDTSLLNKEGGRGIKIQNVVAEQALVERSLAFDSAIRGGEAAALKKLCQEKAASCAAAVAVSATAVVSTSVDNSEANKDVSSALSSSAPSPSLSLSPSSAAAPTTTAAKALKAEEEIWSFLSVLFEGENARRTLLDRLGFCDRDLPASFRKTTTTTSSSDTGVGGGGEGKDGGGKEGGRKEGGEKEGGKEGGQEEQEREKDGGKKKSMGKQQGLSPLTTNLAQDDTGFFDRLEDEEEEEEEEEEEGEKGEEEKVNDEKEAKKKEEMKGDGKGDGADENGHSDGNKQALQHPSTHSHPHPHPHPSHHYHMPPTGGEEEIVKALTVGNLAHAAELCLSFGRYADALLIASTAGRDLHQQILSRYIAANPRPYQALITAMVEGDFAQVVKTRPVGNWKETLAMLATYTDREHFTQLAEMLASRLDSAGMHHEASLCFICAGMTDEVISYWIRSAGLEPTCSSPSSDVDGHGNNGDAMASSSSSPSSSSAAAVAALQSVVEKAVVMGLAPGVVSSKTQDGVLANLLAKYASLLAA